MGAPARTERCCKIINEQKRITWQCSINFCKILNARVLLNFSTPSAPTVRPGKTLERVSARFRHCLKVLFVALGLPTFHGFYIQFSPCPVVTRERKQDKKGTSLLFFTPAAVSAISFTNRLTHTLAGLVKATHG